MHFTALSCQAGKSNTSGKQIIYLPHLKEKKTPDIYKPAPLFSCLLIENLIWNPIFLFDTKIGMYLPHPTDLKSGPTPKLGVDLAIATEMF